MPATYTGVTAVEAYLTPEHVDTAHPATGMTLEERFDWCFHTAQHPDLPWDGHWYGATLPALWRNMGGLVAQGTDCRCYFDHTEFNTPSCQKFAKAFIADYPRVWSSHDFAVGTSDAGSKYIAHFKGMVINSPRDGRAIPPRQYETVDEAAADGYPLTWAGSWNPSPGASSQSNFVILMPGVPWAQDVSAMIARLIAYAMAKEARYQPLPQAGAGG